MFTRVFFLIGMASRSVLSFWRQERDEESVKDSDFMKDLQPQNMATQRKQKQENAPKGLTHQSASSKMKGQREKNNKNTLL